MLCAVLLTSAHMTAQQKLLGSVLGKKHKEHASQRLLCAVRDQLLAVYVVWVTRCTEQHLRDSPIRHPLDFHCGPHDGCVRACGHHQG